MQLDGWVRVQDLRWFDEGVSCLIVDDQRYFFVRSTDGSLKAYEAKCSHKAGQLTEDDLNNTILTCPLHGWHFDLSEGGRELHGYADLPHVRLQVVDGAVYIHPESGSSEDW